MSASPKVWSKFSAKRKDGSVLNLRIMEMPRVPSVQEKVLDLLMTYFVPEEHTMAAAGVADSKEAMEEMYEFQNHALNMESMHIVICCLDTEDDQIGDIMGCSLMMFVRKEDPTPEFKFRTKEMEKVMEIVLQGFVASYDEMKVFDLDLGLIARGISVHPKYRGLGIAQEFLRTRRLICKEYGIPINGAWMTSYGTQIAAERDGWETVCELQHSDLEKKFNVKYAEEPPSTKFMIARIQL
uniref:SFRICE_007143 n=1 Tax=Spodoptera frugiperda TaxID=7108 RepID=A0A2H1W5S8_SPOFR